MSDEQQTTAPRRVVVAEDESLIRMDIVEILRDNGYDVVADVGDGEVLAAVKYRNTLYIGGTFTHVNGF